MNPGCRVAPCAGTRNRARSIIINISIQKKIFGVFIALILLMSGVAAFSAYRVQLVGREITAVVEYYIKINYLIEKMNAYILEEEVFQERVFRLYEVEPRDKRAIADTIGKIKQRAGMIRAELKEVRALIKAALEDSSAAVDRVGLARIDGFIAAFESDYEEFHENGRRALDALAKGDMVNAHRLEAVVERSENRMDAQLAKLREAGAKFTWTAGRRAEEHEELAIWSSIVSSVLAAILGLLTAFIISKRLTKPIRSLTSGTQEIMDGNLNVEIPVTTRDELGTLVNSFNHMVGEMRAKEKIKSTFGQYVDPRIVEGLLEGEGGGLQDGRRENMTVFFSDIASFTSISEKLGPSVLVQLINEYLTAMTGPISEYQGVIDKYVGDAIMAFWGSPFVDGDEHTRLACLTALKQMTALEEFNQRLDTLIGVKGVVPRIDIRIGINTGEVIAGNVGSHLSRNFTVMGDTVNLASRLEGANKAYGTRVLIAQTVREGAREHIEARELDFIRVKGKEEPIRVFELVAEKGGLSPEGMDFIGRFEAGLAAYRQRDWSAAEADFRGALELGPGDYASRLFLKRIEHFRAAPPPDEWDGVWKLTSK